MRESDAAGKGKKNKKNELNQRFGGGLDRKSAAFARGARPNARRLPTRTTHRGGR
ncbi:hypothetical protein [Actinomadura craniellae]|uniref:hypothetical protein n=1 Tax=Actinomadura craniellae TaxID=2231787 RepID=UPI0013141F79|nr:hypothetical protein [Actinomadura craniellae]